MTFVGAVLATWGTAAPRAERGQAPGRMAAVDLELATRLAGGDDNADERVIVTLARGRKRGMVAAMKAQGLAVTGDFTSVDAMAVRLPRGLVRQLRRHPDVVGISTDAPIRATSLTTPVSGTPANSPYTLRSTLGLTTVAKVSVGTSSTVAASLVRYPVVAHTVPSTTGRLLLVAVSVAHPGGGRWGTSVTYAGQALTLAQARSDGSGGQRVEIWRLANPPAGTGNVLVTLNARADAAVVAATTLTGVDTTAPISGTGAMSGSASPWVSLASMPQDLVFGAAAVGNTTLTPASGQASSWSLADANLRTRAVGGSRQGTTTTTLSWQASATQPWAAVAVSVRGAVSHATTRAGAGVTVAVIDSGLLQDDDGTNRIRTTRDFTYGATNPPSTTPIDGYGHGTHVAGLIGGARSDVMGVAPQVSFVSLRVLDNYGAGYTSHVINAIDWAVANKAAYGIDVINLSLGHPIFEPAATDPLVQAVEAATRAGIVVVASAGNYGKNPVTGVVGYAGVSSPGNAPSAITVGATMTGETTTRVDDLIADYSSRGPTWYDGRAKPDVVAPGHRLLGPTKSTQMLYCLFPGNLVTVGGRTYLRLSGTSMAAGVVSGSVALLIEAARATSGTSPAPNLVKAMLQHSALPMGDATGTPYHVLAQGAGSLNAAGALDLARSIDTNAPTAAWLTQGLSETTTIDGQNIVWGENIVWGDNVVWGESVYTRQSAWANNIVWGTNVVWGQNVVWGNNIVWGENVVWGNNIVWGNNVVWGENIVWGENVVWGENIVWADNVVWGESFYLANDLTVIPTCGSSGGPATY